MKTLRARGQFFMVVPCHGVGENAVIDFVMMVEKKIMAWA